MSKARGYFRFFIRNCIPIIAIAIIVFLSEEKRLFLDVMLFPVIVAIFLITWATIKSIGRLRSGQLIGNQYIAVYGLALIITAAGACFVFLFEAIGSHGTDHGMFKLKSLFALTAIVAYPLVDLIIFRFSQIYDIGKEHKIRQAAFLTNVIFLVVAAFLLFQIIWPPLNMALRLQYRGIAIALINSGADVQGTDRYGATPLWYALHRTDKDMATMLLNKGAIFDKRFAGRGLVRAVEDNNTDMLMLLLSKGADADSTYMGATPLVYACQSKNMTMIRILLDNGADINIKSHYPNMPYDGKSPLDIAAESGNVEIVRLLLSHGKKP